MHLILRRSSIEPSTLYRPQLKWLIVRHTRISGVNALACQDRVTVSHRGTGPYGRRFVIFGSDHQELAETADNDPIATGFLLSNHNAQTGKNVALEAAHTAPCLSHLACHRQQILSVWTHMTSPSTHGSSRRGFPDQFHVTGGLVSPDHPPPIA